MADFGTGNNQNMDWGVAHEMLAYAAQKQAAKDSRKKRCKLCMNVHILERRANVSRTYGSGSRLRSN